MGIKITEMYSNVETLTGQLSKNSRGEVIQVVKGVAKKGDKQEKIDIRTYYFEGEDQCVGKGVAIPMDSALDVALGILKGLGIETDSLKSTLEQDIQDKEA